MNAITLGSGRHWMTRVTLSPVDPQHAKTLGPIHMAIHSGAASVDVYLTADEARKLGAMLTACAPELAEAAA